MLDMNALKITLKVVKVAQWLSRQQEGYSPSAAVAISIPDSQPFAACLLPFSLPLFSCLPTLPEKATWAKQNNNKTFIWKQKETTLGFGSQSSFDEWFMLTANEKLSVRVFYRYRRMFEYAGQNY